MGAFGVFVDSDGRRSPVPAWAHLALALAAASAALRAERKKAGLCLKCGSRGEWRGGGAVCAEHGLIFG